MAITKEMYEASRRKKIEEWWENLNYEWKETLYNVFKEFDRRLVE